MAGVLTWFFGGDQTKAMNRPDLRRTMETAMGMAMGDLTGAVLDKAHTTHWGREPFTCGAYINFRPGQFIRFGGLTWLEQNGKPARIARSGPVLFAGEHLSDAWPGYMNGALQTGRLAASTICAKG
jgi:monoamine oxidase